VYPTVLLSGEPQMTDLSQAGVDLVLDPLLAQAARFTSLCEVYAPLYRQNGLSGGAIAEGANSEIPLQDVRDAFAYYLAHHNRGRNFVLMGHSQGTFMLTSMIAKDVDPNPELRAKLISALLIGGQPWVPVGQTVGGSFKNIPLCQTPGQAGCALGYVSFPAEAPPNSSAVFGKVVDVFGAGTAQADAQVACVNPVPLAKRSGKFAGSYFALNVTNSMLGASVPASVASVVTTPFVIYRDLFKGECTLKDGYHYLQISAEPAAGDTRELPTYRNQLVEGIGFGLHLVDYNLPLDDLIETVRLQAAAMP
jgi:hypothetical protein